MGTGLDVKEDNVPEENNPVVASLPEASSSYAPLWVVLILEHHVRHLQEGKRIVNTERGGGEGQLA